MFNKNPKIAIIGQGYVGLPLAVAFAVHYPTIGFDIDKQRIAQLKQNQDRTLETNSEQLQTAQQQGLQFSTDIAAIKHCNCYIVTVPTPVDSNNNPDLSPLKSATKTLCKVLKKGDVVVYESTVYPGATEQVCGTIIEQQTGFKLNQDYFLGYSPERINPGDKVHTLTNIVKVVSGSNRTTAEFLQNLYDKIIEAGTHLAPTIQVAEAAKAIENTQRDINIAFMNELLMMFAKMGIDVLDVIETAATKWNFLKFTPGLVGGHCIGIDPYYLIHKSQEKGYYPELIATARRINEQMPNYVTSRILKSMALHKKHIIQANILVMGLTFKENCPDLRNTRVADIIMELRQLHANVDVHDPWANPKEAKQLLNLELQSEPNPQHYDMIILAVPHQQYCEQDLRQYLKPDGLLFDLKGALPKASVDERL